MHGLKFTDYNDIEVYVEPNGDFTCRMNEGFLREASFERLKLRIESEMKATATAIKLDLPCVCLVREEDETHRVIELKLIGLSRSSSELKWKGFSGNVEIALPATTENAAWLKGLGVALDTIHDTEQAISARKIEYSRYAGRIQASEYAKCMETLKARYDAAMKAS